MLYSMMAPTRSDVSSQHERGSPGGESSSGQVRSDAVQENRRKRKRIPIACSACRARKSRCDGARPRCSFCVAQRAECHYANLPVIASAATTSTLKTVVARLDAIERDLRTLKRPQHSTALSHASPENDCDDPPLLDVAGTETDSGISPGGTDGVGTIEFSVEQGSAFFGPSSNIAFTRLIRRSIFSALHGLEPLNSRDRPQFAPFHGQDELAVSRPESPDHASPPKSWPSTTARKALHLPPEDEIMRLIQRFFSDTALLFPYIHEESFWGMYKVSKESNFRGVRQSWLGLLYMILAMAASTTPDAADLSHNSVNSDSFFAYAESLCFNQMMVNANLESIQVMLLMVQYLQGTRRSVQTWTMHGHAVRAAIQLGLHSSDALEGLENLEREVRIRIWYCCIILDRTLSLSFGRPPAIPEQYIRIRLPSHHFPARLGQTEQLQWSAEENSTLFWNATITLYHVVNKLLDTLYGYNLGSGNLPTIAETASLSLTIEQQLRSWQSSLPVSISLVNAADFPQIAENSLLCKLRVVLTMRFHNTRILAHRPVLDRHLQHLSGVSMDEHEIATLKQLGNLSRGICLQSVEAVLDLVSMILSLHGHQRDYFGAWWFTMYYTFNAGMTVAAILLCDDSSGNMLSDPTAVEKAKSLLERAISCLPLLESSGRMAEKCTKFMSAISHYIHLLRSPRNIQDTQNDTLDNASILPDQRQTYAGTTNEAVNIGDWPSIGSLEFPIFDFDPSGTRMQEFSYFIAPPDINDLGQGDLLW